MINNLDKILVEIEKYCSVNDIEDVEGFVLKCMSDGFSIARYGVSPQDNKAREDGFVKHNSPVSVDIVSASVDADGSLLFSIASSDGMLYDVKKLPSELSNLPLKKQRKIKEKING